MKQGPAPVGDSANVPSVPPPKGAPVVRRDEHAVHGDPERYSTGAVADCPPQLNVGPHGPLRAACDSMREAESCQVHERVQCRQGCYGYRTRRFSCKDAAWALQDVREPACICEPQQALPQLAACTLQHVSVKPSAESLSDGCSLGLRCEAHDLRIECDGENDGTGTSLCTCWRDRHEVTIGGNPYAGEGPRACFSAAAVCAAKRP